MPGRITFGGYYDTSDFDDVDSSGRSQRGNYGLYLLVDQTVHREAAPAVNKA